MRTKKRGGGVRPKTVDLPPQPPPPKVLLHQSSPEAHTYCSYNDIPLSVDSGNSVQIIESETIFRTKKSEQRDCWERCGTEKHICLKCDKGNNVLVCGDSSCPIAVHENCLGRPPWFDEMGNFYCPFCCYKQNITQLCRARENVMLKKKALSIFLDKKVCKGYKQKAGPRIAKRKELTLSTVDGNKKDRRDGDNVANQSVQLREVHQQEIVADEGTTSVLPLKGADSSFVNKQIDVLPATCGENARPNECGSHGIVAGNQTNSEPIIARGSNGLGCREKRIAQQFEIVEIGKNVQTEHQGQFDEIQDERVIEDQQEVGDLCVSSEEEETCLDGALKVSKKRKRSNEGILKEKEKRRAEAEQGWEQAEETIASFTRGDPATRVEFQANGYFETRDSICTDVETVSSHNVKQKDEDMVQPLNADPPHKSYGKSSSELRSCMVQNDKNDTCSSVKQLEVPSIQIVNPASYNVRRKKVPWRDEEEDMLKEDLVLETKAKVFKETKETSFSTKRGTGDDGRGDPA